MPIPRNQCCVWFINKSANSIKDLSCNITTSPSSSNYRMARTMENNENHEPRHQHSTSSINDGINISKNDSQRFIGMWSSLHHNNRNDGESKLFDNDSSLLYVQTRRNAINTTICSSWLQKGEASRYKGRNQSQSKRLMVNNTRAENNSEAYLTGES